MHTKSAHWMIELSLEEFPGVQRWLQRIEARDAVQKGVKVGSSRSPEEMKKAFADVRLSHLDHIHACITWLTYWLLASSVRITSLRVARCEPRSRPWTTATSTRRLRVCTVRPKCMRVGKRFQQYKRFALPRQSVLPVLRR